MEPAVFLDRDNTLILNDGDLGDPSAVKLIDGVAPGLKALREAGFRLIVVTNQGGVARGRYTEADVDAVHQRIAHLVEQTAGGQNLIDRFYYCPYHPQGTVENYRRDHPWRKPHPGMLLQAARDMHLDLPQSWMIGNESRDIEAGRNAGCRTVLVSSGQNDKNAPMPTASVPSFTDAVQIILRGTSTRSNGVHAPVPATKRHSSESPSPQDSPPAPVTAPAPSPAGPPAADPLHRVQTAVRELIDELRSERRMRSEFTALRMAAGAAQLLAVLLALLGIMQIAESDTFFKWMLGAVLLQLMTIALLLLDSRR